MFRVCIIAFLTIPNAFGEAPVNITAENYDPADLLTQIFNTNNTIPRSNKGLVQFQTDNLKPDFVSFEASNQLSVNNGYEQGIVKFREDLDNVDYQKSEVKFQDIKENKKRRKKRKPRQHYGLQHPYPVPNYGPGPVLNPSYGGQYFRPRPPRPEPSLASEAVSRLTEALTSIALYDDYQCVARLLCEAAGGGALGSSGLLQTVAGLEPLLTLLSAYNGLSTNPLFVFGRAVFLGMSAKGNTASCRYGYPLCPTDPEQLVHYLNNHNGGFFRFFNAPQQQGQQNIEQFYNQLSQNYGQYPQQQNQQNYGIYEQQQQQNLGLHQQHQQNQQHYGFYNPNPGLPNYGNPNIYSNGQKYGLAFPYNDYRIQKRIQNKPNSKYVDDYEEENLTWKFPNDNKINYDNHNTFNDNTYTAPENSAKKDNALKFPEYNNIEHNVDDYNRKTRGFHFPDSQSNRQYNDNNNGYEGSNNDYNYNNRYNYYTNKNVHNNNEENRYVKPSVYVKPNNDYNSNNRYHNNYYVNNNVQNNNDYDKINGIQTVYVVRGNGDPNKPEIIKLRPGETVH